MTSPIESAARERNLKLIEAEKDRISHRGRALRALRDVLEAPAPS